MLAQVGRSLPGEAVAHAPSLPDPVSARYPGAARDGLGMPSRWGTAYTVLPMDTPPSSIPSSRASTQRVPRPIFVDSTGRKLRLMRVMGAVALILVVAYLGVVGLALLGGSPNAAAPFLPAPAAPAASPAPAAPSPSAPASLAGNPAAGAGAQPAPGGNPVPAAQIAPVPAATAAAGGAAAAAQPAPAPTAAAVAPAPTAVATQPSGPGNPAAPGQTRRATPPAHP
ncbi:hypothetical protein SAT01_40260 [Sinomonas atrocyanea]|nr:hypothetical protein SAT01_40260 [Sinomonas atrocyanea]